MKQFYKVFSNEKLSTLSTQLTWSHYTELLPIKDINKILFYLNICINQNLDVRSLRKKIKANEFERLPEDTQKSTKNIKSDIISFVKNPIKIYGNKNCMDISEKALQMLIVDNIELFMNELGESYSFIGKEYRIKIGNVYNYIDLLFFNYLFNCFVVIELKTTELKKEHIGQIGVYMNYIDQNLKRNNHNKSIGIIICKEDNNFVIKYCSDKRIIARRYELV